MVKEIYNQLELIGRVGKDSELAFTSNGKSYCKFDLAVWQGKDKPTMWLPVTCWEEMAEVADNIAYKGARVRVVGRLVRDEWIDKQDKKQFRFAVIANLVESKPVEKVDDSSPF